MRVYAKQNAIKMLETVTERFSIKFHTHFIIIIAERWVHSASMWCDVCVYVESFGQM